jgi:hypothetical protein
MSPSKPVRPQIVNEPIIENAGTPAQIPRRLRGSE